MIAKPENAPTVAELETALEVLRIHDVLVIGSVGLDELVRLVALCSPESTSPKVSRIGKLVRSVLAMRALLVLASENQAALASMLASKSAEADRNLAEIKRLDLKLAQLRHEIEELRAANVALSREVRP